MMPPMAEILPAQATSLILGFALVFSLGLTDLIKAAMIANIAGLQPAKVS